jgi:cytochrome c2
MRLVLILLVAACDSRGAWPTTGGSPARGRTAIEHHGCTACHDIPDVDGPRGRVGPSLDGFAQRSFIAGIVPNTPSNLEKWVRDPHGIEPRTAMPDTNLSPEEARDVAAYLYTCD